MYSTGFTDVMSFATANSQFCEEYFPPVKRRRKRRADVIGEKHRLYWGKKQTLYKGLHITKN